MNQRLLAAAIFSLLVILTACSSQKTESPTHSFRIYEEDGVTIAETTGGPKYKEPLFIYQETLRLMEDESVEESLLTQPIGMSMDEDGMVYVLDQSELIIGRRIVVFNQGGEFSHAIGRIGYAPGEYQSPQIPSIREGVITIFDKSLRRLSFFSHDGSFLRLHTCEPGHGGDLDRVYLDSEDNMIMIYEVRYSAIYEAGYHTWKAVIISADGDTLGVVETPRTITGRPLMVQDYFFYLPVLFSGRAQIIYAPDRGIMITTGEEPVIEWYGLNGKLNHVYRLGLEPMPITDEDRALADMYFEQVVFKADQPIGQAAIRTRKRDPHYPEQKAFWNSASIDESGYLWLKDSTSFFQESKCLFHVVNPEGEYLGDSLAPPGIGMVSHGYYLAIDEDENTGANQLIVYSIIPAVKGLKYP